MSAILKVVSALKIPISTSPFFINEENLALVGIRYTDNFFREQFLGMEETPEPEHILYCSNLLESAEDKQILFALRGRERGWVSIFDMLFLAKGQKCETPGFFLNNGVANLGFTYDRRRRPCVIGFCSTPAGWSVYADRDNRVKWGEGRRTISRDISSGLAY